jgi:hypothetical protein
MPLYLVHAVVAVHPQAGNRDSVQAHRSTLLR